MSDPCAISGCPNKLAKGSRYCDKHRRAGARPELPAPRIVEREVKDDARRAAKKAMARLVTNLDVGPPSSQIAAARAVLGIAGVQLQPDATVKHQHEVPVIPAGVTVADLVALVRGLASPREPQQVVVDVTPAPQPLVGAMAILPAAGPVTPDDPQTGPIDAQAPEIVDISPQIAPSGPGPSEGPSGL